MSIYGGAWVPRRAAVRGHDRTCVTSKKEDTHTRSACMRGGRKHKHARRLADKLSPITFFQFSIVLHVYVSVYLHTLLWLFTAVIILVFRHDSSVLALDYDYNSDYSTPPAIKVPCCIVSLTRSNAATISPNLCIFRCLIFPREQ